MRDAHLGVELASDGGQSAIGQLFDGIFLSRRAVRSPAEIRVDGRMRIRSGRRPRRALSLRRRFLLLPSKLQGMDGPVQAFIRPYADNAMKGRTRTRSTKDRS